MFCRKCGNKLEDGSAYCSHCGTEVKPVTAPSAPTEPTALVTAASAKKAVWPNTVTLLLPFFVIITIVICILAMLQINHKAKITAIVAPVNGFAVSMAELDLSGASAYFVPNEKKLLKDTVQFVESLPFGEAVMDAIPLISEIIQIQYTVAINEENITVPDETHAVIPANITLNITTFYTSTEQCFFYVKKVDNCWYIDSIRKDML